MTPYFIGCNEPNTKGIRLFLNMNTYDFLCELPTSLHWGCYRWTFRCVTQTGQEAHSRGTLLTRRAEPNLWLLSNYHRASCNAWLDAQLGNKHAITLFSKRSGPPKIWKVDDKPYLPWDFQRVRLDYAFPKQPRRENGKTTNSETAGPLPKRAAASVTERKTYMGPLIKMLSNQE